MSFYARKQPSKAARERVARQMQALDARIEKGTAEQINSQPLPKGLFKLVLGNFRVNFVSADEGRGLMYGVFIFVGFIASVVLMLGMLAITSYVTWRFFIPVISDRLNIPSALSTAVFIASLFHFEGYGNNGILGRQWGLQHLNLSLVRLNRQAYLGINVVGGVMPVAIALYQLTRVPIAPTLFITGLVAVVGYFSARVVPEFGIFLVNRQMQLIALAAALMATLIIGSAQPTGVSAAFTGCVMGSLIGADLLHLKDLRLSTATRSINIGGGGLNDGILLLGLMALLTAEYFPKCLGWIDRHSALAVHYPFVAVLVGISASLLILRGCYKTHLWTLSKGVSPSNRILYLGTLADGYAQKGHTQKAEKLYKQAIALCKPLKAEDCHHKIVYLLALAWLYTQQDRQTEEDLTYQQVLPLAKQYAVANPSELLAILFNLAQLRERQQRYNEARRLYIESLVWIDRFIRASIEIDDLDALTQAIKTRLTTMVLVT